MSWSKVFKNKVALIVIALLLIGSAFAIVWFSIIDGFSRVKSIHVYTTSSSHYGFISNYGYSDGGSVGPERGIAAYKVANGQLMIKFVDVAEEEYERYGKKLYVYILSEVIKYEVTFF